MSKGKSKSFTFNDPQVQERIAQAIGKLSDTVFHSPVPFEMGYEAGGGADIFVFTGKIEGFTYVTGDLIGRKQQKSDAGNYELMICQRKANDLGAKLISQLAWYTLEASLNSYETMDIGPFAKGNISAVIFERYDSFEVEHKKIGLMLLVGITDKELEWKKEFGGDKLIEKLKEHDVYPYTDFKRKSIL